METKYGFTRMNLSEFENWIAALRVGRTILKVQHHHTYIPSYSHFTGFNHLERQLAMKNFHINQNGWADIGQQITIFPDGDIVTGRSFEKSPACILNQNANAICIENFGNFDSGGDSMTTMQKISIIGVTAALCTKFNLAVTSNNIVYHHWYRLDNGSGNNKSCPGTNFFGGNKVADFEKNLAPLIRGRIGGVQIRTNIATVQKYVCVSADELNVRVQANSTAAKAIDRTSVKMGSILRVYAEQDNWIKISNSCQHWVSSKYTFEVKRALVNATSLNVRTGPDNRYPKNSKVVKDEEVFVYDEQNGYCKIGSGERWVSRQYLSFEA